MWRDGRGIGVGIPMVESRFQRGRFLSVLDGRWICLLSSRSLLCSWTPSTEAMHRQDHSRRTCFLWAAPHMRSTTPSLCKAPLWSAACTLLRSEVHAPPLTHARTRGGRIIITLVLWPIKKITPSTFFPIWGSAGLIETNLISLYLCDSCWHMTWLLNKLFIAELGNLPAQV